MLEILFWVMVVTAGIVVLGIFFIMVVIVLCGVLGLAGGLARALAWVLEKIGHALPDPAQGKDR